MKATSTNEEVLLDASSDAIGALDVLLEKCLPLLTANVWQTCCWPDGSSGWTIGDFRFMILEFEPARNVMLYVQLWSEPHEPVLMEVCSGNWNPGALKYVWRQQGKALQQRGFTVGGAARNFQKEFVVTSPEEAEALATEMLSIVFELLEYRGGQPLMMTVDEGSRSKQRAVHASLTPEDFAKIAARCGFRTAVMGADTDPPVVTLERGPCKSMAIFRWPAARDNLFRAVLLRANVRDANRIASLDTGDHEQSIAGRFVRDHDGDLFVETLLQFDGGVTTEWIVQSLNGWGRAVRKYQQVRKTSRDQTAHRTKPSIRRMSVH